MNYALLLAAGRSTRMGEQNKLRMPYRGKPIVYHAAKAYLDAGLSVLVVLGHEAEAVKMMLPDSKRISTILSPRYALGLSFSLSMGLRNLPSEARWVIVGLGDMPMVQSTTIARLAAATRSSGAYAIVPTFMSEWGNPVALAPYMVQECLNLQGDRGAGQILRQYPNLVEEMDTADEGVVRDVDTPELYNHLRRLDRY